jgi:hypothetical protein
MINYRHSFGKSFRINAEYVKKPMIAMSVAVVALRDLMIG